MERQVDSPERTEVGFEEVFGDHGGSHVERTAPVPALAGDPDVDLAPSISAFREAADADRVAIRALQTEAGRVAEEFGPGGERRLDGRRRLRRGRDGEGGGADTKDRLQLHRGAILSS